MTAENEFFEVYNRDLNKPVQVYVMCTADYTEAIFHAAKLEYAEIVVTTDWHQNGTVVFSDDPDIMSGRWWQLQVLERRRYLGR